MNRTLKLALAAVITTALFVPALAQDSFPDVPDVHWAYKALEQLKKDGILVGYPDGMFRGNRPASRYELAVAINAAYTRLQGMMSGFNDQIKALDDKIANLKDHGSEIQELRDQLAALKSTVDGMNKYGDDIAKLQKLCQGFEKQLAELGVDVPQMQKELKDLADQMKNMPKPAVDIHGDVNLVAIGGFSTDNSFGLTPYGRPLGVGRGTYAGAPVGISRDLTVLHEAALTFSGTNTEGPKWHATIVNGNLFEAAGNYNAQMVGMPFSEGTTSTYFETFGVNFDTSLLGQGFSAEVGRLKYQVGPYLWKRVDFTDWYKNSRWDDGNFIFDGALLKFGFGQAKFHIWAGRNNGRYTDKGGEELNPTMVDQSLGAQLVFPISDLGSINLAYLWQDSNTAFANPVGSGFINRMNTYGGEINLKFQDFRVYGAYSKSQLSYNNSSRVDNENAAWDVHLGYDQANWGAGIGYREIGGNFVALGDWGRIGTWVNPSNIKGVNANIYFKPTADFKISAKGEFLKGKTNNVNGFGPFDYGLTGIIGPDDKVDSYGIQLDYKLNASWNLMLGYEDVRWRYNGALNDPKQRWYTLGLAYNLGKDASLMLTWMQSDLKHYGMNVGLGSLTGTGPDDQWRGGMIATQLSIKF